MAWLRRWSEFYIDTGCRAVGVMASFYLQRVTNSFQVPAQKAAKITTPGPSNLNQKSILKTMITFGDKCPQNGSKKVPMAPRTHLG